jgi:hypothetical protein
MIHFCPIFLLVYRVSCCTRPLWVHMGPISGSRGMLLPIRYLRVACHVPIGATWLPSLSSGCLPFVHSCTEWRGTEWPGGGGGQATRCPGGRIVAM